MQNSRKVSYCSPFPRKVKLTKPTRECLNCLQDSPFEPQHSTYIMDIINSVPPKSIFWEKLIFHSCTKDLIIRDLGFWTAVLEKTLKSSVNYKEVKPVNSKVNQPWIFIGRTDAEADAPNLWPSDVKSWLIVKDPDAGKDWRQEEKGTTEDEMAGWHHQHNGMSLIEHAAGDNEGPNLVCCSPWDRKESDMLSNWTTATKTTETW